MPPGYEDKCREAGHPDWAWGKDGTPVQLLALFGCDRRFGGRRDADERFVEELRAKGLDDGQVGQRLIRMGWKWLGVGQMQAALNRFNLAFEYAPGNGEVYQGIAIVMANTGQPERVVGYWLRQAAEAPRGGSGRFADYGRFLNMQGEHEAARPWLLKALELEPVNAWAMMNLAHGYFEQDMVAEGCAMVERIAAAEPPPGFDEQKFASLIAGWRDRAEKAGCE